MHRAQADDLAKPGAMTVTLASFRGRSGVPRCAIPDGTVTYNLGLASRLLDQVRWGELYDDGIMFF